MLCWCNWVFGFVEGVGMVMVGNLNKGVDNDGWLEVIGVEVEVWFLDFVGFEEEYFFWYWDLYFFKWVDRIMSCCFKELILLDVVLCVVFDGWFFGCLMVLYFYLL